MVLEVGHFSFLTRFNVQIEHEQQRSKTASVKFSNSQVKSSSQSTRAGTEVSSRTSLYEILKRSSVQSGPGNCDGVVGHSKAIFAAFKVEKKTIKNESVKSI